MATVLNIISIVFFVIGCIFLILAVVYFFKYKIHKVINMLSGRDARKAIANMNNNGVTNNKKIKGNITTKKSASSVASDSTEILNNATVANSDATEILSDTTVADSDATEILDGMATEILR